MNKTAAALEEEGLEVVDLTTDNVLARRPHHARRVDAQMEAMQRLAAVFVDEPEAVLQELVMVALEVCGADSAGVSVEKDDRTEQSYYHWVATAGVYTPFMDASLPYSPSACTVCLARGGPQIFRVNQRFFDLIGVEAAPVLDGILLPWEVGGMRGTIFVISHERDEAFDAEDLRVMQVLARFAAMGVRQHRQQKVLVAQERAQAAAAMANDLAHKINNPLQALTNQLYLAARGSDVEQALARALLEDFEKLQVLVRRLLDVPVTG